MNRGPDTQGIGPADWAWTVTVVLVYLPVALGSLLWMSMWGGRASLIGHTIGDEPVASLGLGLAVAAVVVATGRLASPRLGFARRMEEGLIRTIGPVSTLTCLVLALASSIGEELLFRGVVQEEFGIAVATVLFAAAHVPTERDMWPWPLFALVVGAMLGGLYDLTHAVMAPIVAHFAINFANLSWLAARARAQRPGT